MSARFDPAKPHVITLSGRKVYLTDFRQEDVDFDDIAYSLGGITRWTGHVRGIGCARLSVAEHSLNVYQHAVAADLGYVTQMGALLHDAHEAYLGDIATPVAYAIDKDRISALKRHIQGPIHTSVGLPAVLTPLDAALVKEWDYAELEREDSIRLNPAGYLNADEAYEAFLLTFNQLKERMG